MKHIIIIISLFTILVTSSFSCKKSQETDLLKANGLILYYGDPAVDGCGWMIKINDKVYSPTILEADFQEDSLRVAINYYVLDSTWNCGWRDPGYKIIEIVEISETL